MKDENELKNHMVEGMSFGLMIGTGLGCVLGIFLNKLAVCLGVGMAMGW